jgi:translation initiation factor 2 alpha subunit (eIF-2alpha)
MTSVLTEFENDEVVHLFFMGHMKKRNEVIYSNSESNPSYEELQQALVDMYGDSMKAFEKLISQKKDILKLDAELS